MKVITAYISVSHSKRAFFIKELNVIGEILNKLDIVPFIFIDKYKFEPTQEKQMMQQAMADIDKCDLLIAEVSKKGIGIGIEVGYAKAKNKPVIYIRGINAEHSTTVSGISDFQIIYNDTSDLQQQLSATIANALTTF